MGQYVEFKEGEKHPIKKYDETDKSDNIDAFQDSGYILEDQDLIVDVDCLNHEQIKRMIDVFGIKTQVVWTDRGAHLYFKKPNGFRWKEGPTALGIEVEYKHVKNTKAVTVRRNGKTRQIDNMGAREVLPDYLNINRKCAVLMGMDEGEGRNNAMLAHRRTIGTLKNWKTVVNFINESIFAKPLPDAEIETLCREMSVEAVKGGEAFIAEMIIHEKKVVKYKEVLYFYDGIRYVNNISVLRNIVYDYTPDMQTRYVDEVIKQMKYRIIAVDDNKEFDIKLKNGVLHNGKFYPVDYTDFTPYYIDIDYLPEAPAVQEVDDYISNLAMDKDLKGSEKEYGYLIIEALSGCLITDKGFKRALSKFFFFVGNGGNGKGTFLQIATSILGKENTTTLSPIEMCKESYLVTMQEKLANFGDDIPDEPINTVQMKILKNISTCDRIELRHLYAESISTQISASIIFTCNNILKSFEKGEAFKRRVLWLPMYYKPKFKDRDFIKRLTTKEALEYWFKLVIDGYFRLYENGEYTESKIVNDFTELYHEENDPTNEWLESKKIEDFEGKKVTDVYAEFKLWYECENDVHMKEGQYKKILKNNIIERFDLQEGRIRIDKVLIRAYINNNL